MVNERRIYILLSHSGSMFSRAINICTRKPYTHVSIALDKDLSELYSFGRIKPYNPIIGGFVQESFRGGTYRRFPNTKCALFSLKITQEQYNRLIHELARFKAEKEKYGYNFIGVVSAAFNYPIHREYRYFCSQFVSELLLKSGIKIIDKDPSLTAPMDFAESGELECVYVGYLRTYNSEVVNNIPMQLSNIT